LPQELLKRGTLAAESGKTSDRSWRSLLATAIREPAALLAALDLPADLLPAARRAAAGFPLLVPEPFLARMRPGAIDDPLLRQVLPLAAEDEPQPAGFGIDPLQEAGRQPVPGLLHKYRDRVLLIGTGVCAVHCRYCFRRHFPYQEVPRQGRWWEPALAYVAAHPEIREVIWSGGDPLLLPDDQLAAQAADFATLPQIERLRWHSRLPVVLPQRIDAACCAWLAGLPLTRTVVIHANHPQELDDEVAAACARLRAAGCLLLNQSVLLRGVNDAAPTLAALSRRLAGIGVQPYYLHQLDAVAGAAHFLVDDQRARGLMRALHAELPGWLLPRLVRELPGEAGKTPIPW
jgi:EF-P beta-lysylation protein EpmB